MSRRRGPNPPGAFRSRACVRIWPKALDRGTSEVGHRFAPTPTAPTRGTTAPTQHRPPLHRRSGLANVRKAFGAIWGTEELITSMDAVVIWRPWWAAPEGERWMPRTEGLHLDQNPFSKPQKDCIQGMVPLIDVTEDVGGLQVVPRSHSDEAKVGFRERHPEMDGIGDWCMLKPWDGDGKGSMLLCAEKGDLILWDSRTIHGGIVRKGKQGGATDEAPDLARMTCTVAMTPREWASEEVQQARREGQAAGLSFNHCPHEAGESSGTIHAKRREGFREYELTDAQSEVL
mmetsp:Transcript_100788/g.289079  ORF Transcript_100788/g.289079 Transcript_100788/m.289079 type:complete len:288 (-) Transcript_100788:145-1008(-)